MKQTHSGIIRKLKSCFESPTHPIHYTLPIGGAEIPLNLYLGKKLTLTFTGVIQCLHCGKQTKKSYRQGYCFLCSQTLAQCDFCILKPETCHHHLGTCREPDWAQNHCMVPHIVYVANSSGLKVGITRETQIPTRFIDQGAVQALPLFRVQNRYHAGLLEGELAKTHADKTDWRKMLQGNIETVDLTKASKTILALPALLDFPIQAEPLLKTQEFTFQYPVLEYPKKIKSWNVEKENTLIGQLLGIKGQYLIFDVGVINIRNHSGYHATFNAS